MEQENGLLTAAMVVSGLNGVLDASFDAPLFDAQTDAPDVPEGQDTFAADSLVLPNTPDAPAFAVADASAEHAAPQMFSLHADPVIPEATMHESAAAAPDASPADDASSDAPDLISLLADNDPARRSTASCSALPRATCSPAATATTIWRAAKAPMP